MKREFASMSSEELAKTLRRFGRRRSFGSGFKLRSFVRIESRRTRLITKKMLHGLSPGEALALEALEAKSEAFFDNFNRALAELQCRIPGTSTEEK